jgi:preprotein translocase subunit SecF
MYKLRLIPDHTNFDFVGYRWIGFAITAVMIIGSLFLVSTKGLHLGVDFTGGTLIEVKLPHEPNMADLRTTLNELGIGTVSIQEFGQPDTLLIRFQTQTEGPESQTEAVNKLRAALDAMFAGEDDNDTLVDYRRTEFVGPQVGDELKMQGLYAIIASIIGIGLYVAFRFEWQYGVAGVISLIHDSIAVLGLFALTGMEFDLSTVAAILLVAGYSINDSVIIFDRIREDLRKYKKMPLPDLFNQAINKTLSRTSMTSLTTVLSLVGLSIFGGEVIQGFVYAMIFGIAVGTYSSIFVGGPILIYLNIKRGSDMIDAKAEAT